MGIYLLFTKWVKKQIRYYFVDQLIPEANSFKYLGIIISSDLNWADHENYTLRKPRKAIHNSYTQEGIKSYETFRLCGTSETDT